MGSLMNTWTLSTSGPGFQSQSWSFAWELELCRLQVIPQTHLRCHTCRSLGVKGDLNKWLNVFSNAVTTKINEKSLSFWEHQNFGVHFWTIFVSIDWVYVYLTWHLYDDSLSWKAAVSPGDGMIGMFKDCPYVCLAIEWRQSNWPESL